jgi:hypothetical protein
MKAYAPTLRRALNAGLVFSPEVLSYPVKEFQQICDEAIEMYGRDPKQLNSSFHKSWAKVANAPMELLVLEQIIHYMTTYGAESVGCYDEDRVFIPAEVFDVPEWDDDVDLMVISSITELDLKEKVLQLAGSGIALSSESIMDITVILSDLGFFPSELARVKNRELLAVLCEKFGMVPEDPTEFLRLLVFVTTGDTLLIKNKKTIDAIKTTQVSNLKIMQFFDQYRKTYGLEKLSSIFLRFKPIFLAFKGKDKALNTMINDLRRLAVDHHQPLGMGILDSVATNQKIDLKQLRSALMQATPFRRVRILNSLLYRAGGKENVVYQIRNGKVFAKKRPPIGVRQDVIDVVLESVMEAMRDKVAGKTVLLPDYISYALPSSEKMFVGAFPFGTSVKVDKDMVVGVWWEDQKGDRGQKYRIDLDLSASSILGKIGWDAAYRSRYRDMLFSGDKTSAPNGATEMFHVEPGAGLYSLNLNYFNYNENLPVPAKLFVSKDVNVSRDYMVDQNSVLCVTPLNIDVQKRQLGIIASKADETRFFFAMTREMSGVSHHDKADLGQISREFYLDYYMNMIDLRDVLELAGANIVSKLDDDELADIDLSPNTLAKDSIINLFV